MVLVHHSIPKETTGRCWAEVGQDQADSCLHLVQVPPTLYSGTATVTGGWAVKHPHPQKEHPLRAAGTASTSLAESRAGAITASLALVHQPGTHSLPVVWALSGRLLLWGARAKSGFSSM